MPCPAEKIKRWIAGRRIVQSIFMERKYDPVSDDEQIKAQSRHSELIATNIRDWLGASPAQSWIISEFSKTAAPCSHAGARRP
jgi:hypothetical protein